MCRAVFAGTPGTPSSSSCVAARTLSAEPKWRSSARRRAILRHFGSPEAFLAATQEELEGVPDLPPKTARAIYAQLHKAGRG